MDFDYCRVFKKGAPNGKITVYLGRRDFVDHVSHVDPIDGVVLVDPDYLNERKVFGHVLAAFRYGREDLDVLGKDEESQVRNRMSFCVPLQASPVLHFVKTCIWHRLRSFLRWRKPKIVL